MTTPVLDRTVSRQRRYQLRMVAIGRCMICGRAATRKNHQYCAKHRAQANTARREPPAK